MNKKTTYIAATLQTLAAQYETSGFINGDPSWFMHQVEGDDNKEATAFVASCFSYGSRKLFMPKVQQLLDLAQGDMALWIKSGAYRDDIPDSSECFYRLQQQSHLRLLLDAYAAMMLKYGSMYGFIKYHATDALSAVKALTAYFASHKASATIPKDASSACKRLCMFLRWMVRDNSPVDIGLWSGLIPKTSLIMPLDTHVMQQANRFNLISANSTSMATALKLTATMREIFPDDPLKGDFALFGLGIAPTLPSITNQ